MSNIFAIKLLNSSDEYGFRQFVDRFYAHQTSVHTMTFTGAELLDEQGQKVCWATVSGTVATVVEMFPVDGKFVNGLRFLVTFTTGEVVRVLEN